MKLFSWLIKLAFWGFLAYGINYIYELCDENTNTNESKDEIANTKVAVTKKPWGDGKVRNITEKEFIEQIADFNGDNTYKGDGPAFIEFYATWCGACKRFTPEFEKLAKGAKGKCQFYKVDLENCPALHFAYQITAIPYVLYFNGSEVKHIDTYQIDNELKKLNKK